MRVEWTVQAREQIAAIRQRLALSSPRFADDVADRITRRAAQLEAFPESGAPVRGLEHYGLRYLLEGSYRIVYVLTPDYVAVLGVVDVRRDLL